MLNCHPAFSGKQRENPGCLYQTGDTARRHPTLGAAPGPCRPLPLPRRVCQSAGGNCYHLMVTVGFDSHLPSYHGLEHSIRAHRSIPLAWRQVGHGELRSKITNVPERRLPPGSRASAPHLARGPLLHATPGGRPEVAYC